MRDRALFPSHAARRPQVCRSRHRSAGLQARFYFHGHGSSRLEALALDDAAARAGVRVYAFDRPGIGFSDPKTGDRLLDWPADMSEAADLLGLGGFPSRACPPAGPMPWPVPMP